MTAIRLVAGAFLTTLLVVSLTVAQTSNNPKGQIEDTAVRQAQLSRAFETFRSRLAVMAGRLETSGSAEDKQRAKSLRAALKLINDQNTTGRFDSLIKSLTTRGADQNLDTLALVVKDNQELRKDLQRILSLLLNDDHKATAEKKEALQALLAQLKDLRDKQARLQAATEMGKRDTTALAKAQDKLAEATKDVLQPKDNEKETEREQREKVRKQIESAVAAQGKAGKQLQGGNRDQAGDLQGQALRDLEEAIRRLEDELNQTRQEERRQQLQDLLARCKKMLQMQTVVHEGTAKIHDELTKSKEGKLGLAQVARVNKLADEQRLVAKEGKSALKLVQDEGSAIAFVEVFDGLVKDLDTITERLDRSDISSLTQAIENDAIDTLKEIIRALEKSIGEIQNNENPPLPPPGDGPTPRKKLVDLLQQLKMIKGMQTRIHVRTELFGKRYTGEQAPDLTQGLSEAAKRSHLLTVQELKDLSARQQRLRKVTKDVSQLPEAQQQAMRID